MGKFIHIQTRVRDIRVSDFDCRVTATVETMNMVNGCGFSGPDIDFEIDLTPDRLSDAYDLAVTRGRELFAEFNSKQGDE